SPFRLPIPFAILRLVAMLFAGVRHRGPILLAGALAILAAVAAEVRRPAPPMEYHVELRYRIQAGLVERLRQFHDLVAVLEKHGFHKDPGEDTEAENPNENRMTGTIAGKDARRLLEDPRVKTLLLRPAGYKVPEAAAG